MSNIRYGNFQQKIEDGFCPTTCDLSKVLNSSLESIMDRENMIQEYIAREKESQNLKTDFIASIILDISPPDAILFKAFASSPIFV